MKYHDATGKLLAVHSVVVEERYRGMGVASAMIKDYLLAMERLNERIGGGGGGGSMIGAITGGNMTGGGATNNGSTGNINNNNGGGGGGGKKKASVRMEKIVLIAKKQLLAFYVRNGFGVTKLSDIVHGQEPWFELERSLKSADDDSKSMDYECFIVDAFADVEREGSGNPAGVVLLAGPPGDELQNNNNNNNNTGAEDDSSLDAIDEEEEEGQDKKKIIEEIISPRGIQWMSIVAREFNQSETAFVWPLSRVKLGMNGLLQQQSEEEDGAQSSLYAIRYYTRSGMEVDLCGHATLASASVLLERLTYEKQQGGGGSSSNSSITFCAKHDVLHAKLLAAPCTPHNSSNNIQTPASNASRISMDFPWKDVTPISSGSDDQQTVLNILSKAFFGAASSSSHLVVHSDESALAAKFRQFFNSKDPDLSHHVLHIGTTDEREDLFLELTEEGFDLLKGIRNLDYTALEEFGGYARGVIICCVAGGSLQSQSGDAVAQQQQQQQPMVDFRSRFFGPKVGIDEDPVTGSAHCSLGPYFGTKLNKTVVVGRQESERSGLVECTLKEAEGERRVGLIGTAVRTVSGKLSIRI